MRDVRKITPDEEKCRLEPMGVPGMGMFKVDFVKPEPEGTLVIMLFRVTGYDRDCDGSAMARLERLGFGDMEPSGWEPTHLGLYPGCDIVVTEDDVRELARRVAG